MARSSGESRHFAYDTISSEPAVDEICAEIEGAMEAAFAGSSLRDLVLANPPAGNDGAAPADAATDLVTVVSTERVDGSPEAPAIGGEGEPGRRVRDGDS